MTTIFEGLSTLVNDVFGAEVVHIGQDSVRSKITARIRTMPHEVEDDNGGSVLAETPMMTCPKDTARPINTGDTVINAAGVRYEIIAPHATSNPSTDATVVFVLELLD